MSTSISINATTFAKFCAATGPARITVVREAKPKYNKGYKQGPDYWKPFRDEFVRVMRRSATPTELKAVLNSEHVRPESNGWDGRASWWEANYAEATATLHDGRVVVGRTHGQDQAGVRGDDQRAAACREALACGW